MPLVAFAVKLSRIDESLLYQDPGGNYWLSCVCTLEQDSKERMVVAQSIPKERSAAGERGPTIGTWREIGGGIKPPSPGKGFDLTRYQTATQPGAQQQSAYPQGEKLPPSPQEPQQEARQENKPHGFNELGFGYNYPGNSNGAEWHPQFARESQGVAT